MTSGVEIAAEARQWLGTPFHHQGRVKGEEGGCDCIGLIIGVLDNLDVRDATGVPYVAYDEGDYSREPTGNTLQSHLLKHAFQINASVTPKPGDIALVRFGKEPQHVAWVSNHPLGGQGLIHCYMQVGYVVEHRLDVRWSRRISSFYRIPTITNEL